MISKSFIKVLYTKLTKSNSIWGTMLYNEWRRVYQQVCGYTSDKLEGIEKIYDIQSKNIDHEALLFAIHTYYALIMKLIA
jgi:hypothetical protein